MAVIAPGKLDNLVAFSEATGEADTRHRRFGSTVDHAHFLDRRDPGANQLSHLHFQWMGNSKADSISGRFCDSVSYHLRRVTENRRAPRTHVVNQLAPINVPDVRALGPIDKERFATDGAKCAHGRVHTPGNSSTGMREQLG